MKRVLLIAAGLCAVVLTAPAQAHHAFESEYSCDNPVTITGKVISMAWVNPHTFLKVRVAAPGKPDRDWMIEGGTPGAIARMGLEKDDLKPGMGISVKAHQSKDRLCMQD